MIGRMVIESAFDPSIAIEWSKQTLPWLLVRKWSNSSPPDAVILTLTDFCTRNQIVGIVDQPGLRLIPIDRPDHVVRWIDPDGLEIRANPMIWLVLQAEMQIISEVGGIPRIIGVRNAARGDLDDALVVDIATALRSQARNDLGKSNQVVLFPFGLFLVDENMASSSSSPQPRLILHPQKNPPVRWPSPVASATFNFISAQNASCLF
jgi:hypothetical protein